MPSKRKRSSNSKQDEEEEGTPKRAASEHKQELPDDDWKRPLFFWKGRVKLSSSSKQLTWTGSWFSGLAEKGVPSPEDYESTREDASFELTSTGKLQYDATKEQDDEESLSTPLAGLRGKFKGYYLLDNGDGQQKFRDRTHHFAVSSSSSDDLLLVAASGTSEFGNFVSAGYMSRQEEAESEELVLARRYIGDDDKRNAWKANPKKVLEWCLQQNVRPGDDDDVFWTKLLPRHQS